MTYTFNKLVKGSFEEVKIKVIDSLKSEKFGIITEVQLNKIIKNKLNVDMPRYEILGACSPKHAYDAIMADEDMGAFLPCNITLMEKGEGEISISIVNPIPYMHSVDNKEVQVIANEVSEILKRVSDIL
ncbi:MAG: DUF302 domain-containing protein [Flavobacteriales bacterium]|nr:DUF302 domain-containing protein [Flavobacteriales bacterium]